MLSEHIALLKCTEDYILLPKLETYLRRKFILIYVYRLPHIRRQKTILNICGIGKNILTIYLSVCNLNTLSIKMRRCDQCSIYSYTRKNRIH